MFEANAVKNQPSQARRHLRANAEQCHDGMEESSEANTPVDLAPSEVAAVYGLVQINRTTGCTPGSQLLPQSRLAWGVRVGHTLPRKPGAVILARVLWLGQLRPRCPGGKARRRSVGLLRFGRSSAGTERWSFFIDGDSATAGQRTGIGAAEVNNYKDIGTA